MGNYAYIANADDDGLHIVDISDPTNPLLIGSYEPEGYIDFSDVHVVGNYAYIVDMISDSLDIVDISDPTTPTRTGSIEIDDPGNVQIVGSYAYVSARSDGLQIVDVSDPVTPVLISSIETMGTARDVQVVDEHAYIAQYRSLQVMNISDPTNPILSGNIEIEMPGDGDVSSLQVTGNYAYVAIDGSGLRVVDISDPASPSLAGSYHTSLPHSVNDVQVEGRYAYVSARHGGLQILDISDPTRPTSIGGKEIWRSGTVYIAGNYAYIGAWYGLNILDVSNLVEPARKGTYSLVTEGVADVHVLDGYAYSLIEPASHHVPGFISIIDVRDPANPDTVGDTVGGYGQDDIGDIYGFHVQGNYLYILAHTYVDGKAKALHIVDVQDRANPSLVSSITMTSAQHEYQSDIQVVGNYAYVAGSSLQVVNISDPTNPTLVAGIETPGDNVANLYPHLKRW
jgi:hypothetical protein